jgi:hypothetical protein
MESRRPLRALSVLLALLALLPARALGQDDTYRRLAEDATRAVSEHRLADALTIFREMHALAPSARTLWSLGRVHYELGQYVLSLEYLDQALVDPRRPLEGPQREEALSLQTRARALVGEVAVTVTPADATILVDDTETPGPTLRLDPGEHVVRFERAGFETATRRVLIRGGDRTTLLVTLAESPSAQGGLFATAAILGTLAPPSEIRLAVAPARGSSAALALHLQPLSTGGTIAPIGERALICDAPCAVTRAPGVFAAFVGRPGEEPAPVPGALPLLTDASLTLLFHDEAVTRIAGWIATGLVVGYGLAGTVVGSAAIAVDPDDELRVSLGGSVPGVLLGTGISALLLGLLGLPFALQADWGEIQVGPL